MQISDLSKSLFDNGIDFIQQSLKDFEGGRFKYSVINFSSGVEVILKAVIAADNWILIVKPQKSPTEFKNLLAGTALTIGMKECLDIIQRDLGLMLQKGGDGFMRLASQRNKAIHFFLPTDEGHILAIQYQAFEDLWIFFRRYPGKSLIPAESTKNILFKLGRHLRSVSGNIIDSTYKQLDIKRDQLLLSIKLWRAYKSGVFSKLYRQDVSFLQKNGSAYPDWEALTLGEICTIRAKGEKEVNQTNEFPLRLSNSSGKVSLDSSKNASGRIIAWVKPGKRINHQFLNLVIDQNKRYFGLLMVGATRPIIRISDIANLPVKLPCEKEQVVIAQFLDKIEKRIMLMERQLDLLSDFEKSLKQKLYT